MTDNLALLAFKREGAEREVLLAYHRELAQ